MGNRGFYGFTGDRDRSFGFGKFSGKGVPTSPLAYGPLGWWEADTLSLADGGHPAPWNDSSGNGVNITGAAVSPHFYNAIQNGLGVIRYDNVSTRFECPITSASGNYTFITVIKPASVGAGDYLFDSRQTTGGANRIGFGHSSTNTKYFYVYGTTVAKEGPTPVPYWQVLTCVLNGLTGKGMMYRNYGLLFEDDYVPNTLYSAYATLGSSYAGASASNCDMGEFMAFPVALQQSEIFQIVAYLNQKWAIF